MNIDNSNAIPLIRGVQGYMIDRRITPITHTEANDLAVCWRMVGRLDALIIALGGEVENE